VDLLLDITFYRKQARHCPYCRIDASVKDFFNEQQLKYDRWCHHPLQSRRH